MLQRTNGNKCTHLLPALYRKLRKNIMFKPTNQHCSLHQVVQLFMVTCTLIKSKKSLEDPCDNGSMNAHPLKAKEKLANQKDFISNEEMAYTLAIPVTIFMNILIYIRIQSFQLQHNFNQIIKMYTPKFQILMSYET